MTGPDVERFWSNVNKDGPVSAYRPDLGPCWLWTLSVQRKRGGYGQFRAGHQTLRAHVVAYVLTTGRMPPGLMLDHLCRIPRCVNPRHLEPVTPAENNRRGMSPSAVAFRANTCLTGVHPRSNENTYTRPNGKRECRACASEAQRQRRALGRAA